MRRLILGAALLLGAASLSLVGCDRPAVQAPKDAPPMVVVPGATVDSAIPRGEAIRRFQAGVPPTDSLRGGSVTRDSLVLAFVSAVERGDTARLVELALTKRELAWLYYPTTPQSLPPYALGPDLLWFTLQGRSERGIRRVLGQYGGRPLRFLTYECAGTPSIEGPNRVWGPCAVRRGAARGDTIVESLFGQILERDGRYKFLSYGNKL